MAERALAVVKPNQTSIYRERESWDLMREQANILIKTGFLPESIKTAEQAVMVMMKGRELGVPPLYALSNVVIVKGKPSCSAELMLALIRRDHGPGAIRVKVTDNQRCIVEWRQEGWDGTQTYEFTIEDAKQAQLVSAGGMFSKYPAAMLRARCISAVARMAFPESIAGMYAPGELGDDVTVTDDGEVVSGGRASAPATETEPGDAMFREIANEPERVVDPETGEIIETPAQRKKPDHERAMGHYMAACSDAGLTDTASKLLALACYPTRPDGPTTSRKQLSAQELDDLAVSVKDWMPNPNPLTDYANGIAFAPDQKSLAKLAGKLKDDGIAEKWLRAMWSAKNRQAPAAVAIEPELEPEQPTLDVIEGSAGNDRHTS